MASIFSKPKKFKLSLILFWIVLLFITMINYLYLTINYTRRFHDDEREDMPSNRKVIRKSEWFEVIARQIKDETINIGLVNMDMITDEILAKTNTVKVHFDHVDEEMKWSDLYPERIDENGTSKCPAIPMPRFEDYQELDVVVASSSHVTECIDGSNRDIFRLQLNLVVANLLVRSGRNNDDRPVFAVFTGSCEPMWEIFRCEDIVWHEGDTWIYKPDMRRIRQKMFMPVGGCQFVFPFSKTGEDLFWRNEYARIRQREAYVTILHSSEDYVCGAITLAQSIIRSNSTKDLVLLVDDNITAPSLQGLHAAGWKIKPIRRLKNPKSEKGTYNEWNYSKLRIWQLEEYDKIMFIDADLLVKRNMDHFFMYPQLTAAANYENHLFNSGLMLVEPSRCTFGTLLQRMYTVDSYNGGDQGFLNEIYTWWHRLPSKVNYLKVFEDPEDHLHHIPSYVYAIHYTGLKPWRCLKEYDCNWYVGPEFQRYASNSAHTKWWHVYNTMPENLRQYCSATTKKQILKW